MEHDIFSNLQDNFPKEEMPPKHEVRFAARLDKELHRPIRIRLSYLALAASIIAFLGITIVIYKNLEKQADNSSLFTSIPGEFYEAELFLQDSFNERLFLLKHLKDLDKQVLLDIEEIDKAFKQIGRDLKKNPGDERLIKAAFDIYQIKIDLLDEVLSIVK